MPRSARKLLQFVDPRDMRSLRAERLEPHELAADVDRPVSMVTIIGSGREGKLSLANILSGTSPVGSWVGGVFAVSDAMIACTAGADACLPGEAIEELARRAAAGGRPPIPISPMMARGSVIFCDFEGSGVRGDDFSTALAVPALCLAPVVIFNTMRKFSKVDTPANLALLVDAAARAGGGGGARGHLHIVQRDFNLELAEGDNRYTDTYARGKLASDEYMGHETDLSSDAAARNAQREKVRRAFKSITLWILPNPEATAAASSIFFRRVGDLLHAIATQAAAAPARFGDDAVSATVTARLLPQLLDRIAIEATKEALVPRSLLAELFKVYADAEVATASRGLDALRSLEERTRFQPLSLGALRGAVSEAVLPALAVLRGRLASLGAPPEVISSAERSFEGAAAAATMSLRLVNERDFAAALRALEDQAHMSLLHSIAPQKAELEASLSAAVDGLSLIGEQRWAKERLEVVVAKAAREALQSVVASHKFEHLRAQPPAPAVVLSPNDVAVMARVFPADATLDAVYADARAVLETWVPSATRTHAAITARAVDVLTAVTGARIEAERAVAAGLLKEEAEATRDAERRHREVVGALRSISDVNTDMIVPARCAVSGSERASIEALRLQLIAFSAAFVTEMGASVGDGFAADVQARVAVVEGKLTALLTQVIGQLEEFSGKPNYRAASGKLSEACRALRAIHMQVSGAGSPTGS